jgi:hypothetical protein
MKIVFYSENCEYSRKLLLYLDKYNIKTIFKLVNIDVVDAPKEIDIVPTIVDTDLNQPLKGKKAFEYLLNIKYFNNPTNNIDYVKELPPNPDIPEDEKAVKSKIINLELNQLHTLTDNSLNELFESRTIDDVLEKHELDLENQSINKSTQQMINQRAIQDKKLNLLMQLKGRK